MMCTSMYKTATDAKYELAQFAAPWGSPREPLYSLRKNRFKICMKEFAKDCGIKAIGQQFYYFNGKIYEKVTEFAVCLAYNELMTKLGIAENYPTSITARRELFLNIIIAYNQLHVRNDVLAFSNSVIDLREVKANKPLPIHSFSPRWHVTDYHPYPFNPQAKAPNFMRYLDDVLPDKRQRDILQMFLGLGLIQSSEVFDTTAPRGTVEFCLVLLGSGANGKSVIFNVMTALFGKKHITNIDYDTMTSDGDEGLRGRAAIRSAVFNWSSDSNAKKFCCKNTEMFKRIASGESYPYRLLGQDIAESNNCPYLIFNLNELPRITEATEGLLRRLQFVNFDITIPKYKRDPNLAFKIIDHELSGVFNWVMRGAKEIRRRHFMFPPSDASLRTTVLSLVETNPVSAWILSYRIRPEAQAPGETATIMKSDDLYASFTAFCEANDLEKTKDMTLNKFSRRLTVLNFEKKHKVDGTYFKTYGVYPEKLKKPVVINELRDEEEEALSYEGDDESYIKND